MFLLILDSLGNTELLFILVMALVFFGPRKLPQLSRTLGKNIAEFRKASEDFKRTWEREVALEESQDDWEPSAIRGDHSIVNSEEENREYQEPMIETLPAEEAVARETMSSTTEASGLSTETDNISDTAQSDSPRKQDWL